MSAANYLSTHCILLPKVDDSIDGIFKKDNLVCSTNVHSLEMSFDAVHDSVTDIKSAVYDPVVSPLIRRAAEGDSTLCVLSGDRDESYLTSLLNTSITELLQLSVQDDQKYGLLKLTWFTVGADGFEAITDLLKPPVVPSSSGASTKTIDLVLRDLTSGRGMIVPGLVEAVISGPEDLQAVLEHVHTHAASLLADASLHSVVQVTFTDLRVATSSGRTKNFVALGAHKDPAGLGRVTLIQLSGLRSDGRNLPTPTVRGSPSPQKSIHNKPNMRQTAPPKTTPTPKSRFTTTPVEAVKVEQLTECGAFYPWIEHTRHVMQWMENKRASTPFHKSRLLLLLKDVLLRRQEAALLLILHPTAEAHVTNLDWLRMVWLMSRNYAPLPAVLVPRGASLKKTKVGRKPQMHSLDVSLEYEAQSNPTTVESIAESGDIYGSYGAYSDNRMYEGQGGDNGSMHDHVYKDNETSPLTPAWAGTRSRSLSRVNSMDTSSHSSHSYSHAHSHSRPHTPRTPSRVNSSSGDGNGGWDRTTTPGRSSSRPRVRLQVGDESQSGGAHSGASLQGVHTSLVHLSPKSSSGDSVNSVNLKHRVFRSTLERIEGEIFEGSRNNTSFNGTNGTSDSSSGISANIGERSEQGGAVEEARPYLPAVTPRRTKPASPRPKIIKHLSAKEIAGAMRALSLRNKKAAQAAATDKVAMMGPAKEEKAPAPSDSNNSNNDNNINTANGGGAGSSGSNNAVVSATGTSEAEVQELKRRLQEAQSRCSVLETEKGLPLSYPSMEPEGEGEWAEDDNFYTKWGPIDRKKRRSSVQMYLQSHGAAVDAPGPPPPLLLSVSGSIGGGGSGGGSIGVSRSLSLSQDALQHEKESHVLEVSVGDGDGTSSGARGGEENVATGPGKSLYEQLMETIASLRALEVKYRDLDGKYNALLDASQNTNTNTNDANASSTTSTAATSKVSTTPSTLSTALPPPAFPSAVPTPTTPTPTTMRTTAKFPVPVSAAWPTKSLKKAPSFTSTTTSSATATATPSTPSNATATARSVRSPLVQHTSSPVPVLSTVNTDTLSTPSSAQAVSTQSVSPTTGMAISTTSTIVNGVVSDGATSPRANPLLTLFGRLEEPVDDDEEEEREGEHDINREGLYNSNEDKSALQVSEDTVASNFAARSEIPLEIESKEVNAEPIMEPLLEHELIYSEESDLLTSSGINLMSRSQKAPTEFISPAEVHISTHVSAHVSPARPLSGSVSTTSRTNTPTPGKYSLHNVRPELLFKAGNRSSLRTGAGTPLSPLSPVRPVLMAASGSSSAVKQDSAEPESLESPFAQRAMPSTPTASVLAPMIVVHEEVALDKQNKEECEGRVASRQASIEQKHAVAAVVEIEVPLFRPVPEPVLSAKVSVSPSDITQSTIVSETEIGGKKIEERSAEAQTFPVTEQETVPVPASASSAAVTQVSATTAPTNAVKLGQSMQFRLPPVTSRPTLRSTKTTSANREGEGEEPSETTVEKADPDEAKTVEQPASPHFAPSVPPTPSIPSSPPAATDFLRTSRSFSTILASRRRPSRTKPASLTSATESTSDSGVVEPSMQDSEVVVVITEQDVHTVVMPDEPQSVPQTPAPPAPPRTSAEQVTESELSVEQMSTVASSTLAHDVGSLPTTSSFLLEGKWGVKSEEIPEAEATGMEEQVNSAVRLAQLPSPLSQRAPTRVVDTSKVDVVSTDRVDIVETGLQEEGLVPASSLPSFFPPLPPSSPQTARSTPSSPSTPVMAESSEPGSPTSTSADAITASKENDPTERVVPILFADEPDVIVDSAIQHQDGAFHDDDDKLESPTLAHTVSFASARQQDIDVGGSSSDAEVEETVENSIHDAEDGDQETIVDVVTSDVLPSTPAEQTAASSHSPPDSPAGPDVVDKNQAEAEQEQAAEMEEEEQEEGVEGEPEVPDHDDTIVYMIGDSSDEEDVWPIRTHTVSFSSVQSNVSVQSEQSASGPEHAHAESDDGGDDNEKEEERSVERSTTLLSECVAAPVPPPKLTPVASRQIEVESEDEEGGVNTQAAEPVYMIGDSSDEEDAQPTRTHRVSFSAVSAPEIPAHLAVQAAVESDAVEDEAHVESELVDQTVRDVPAHTATQAESASVPHEGRYAQLAHSAQPTRPNASLEFVDEHTPVSATPVSVPARVPVMVPPPPPPSLLPVAASEVDTVVYSSEQEDGSFDQEVVRPARKVSFSSVQQTVHFPSTVESASDTDEDTQNETRSSADWSAQDEDGVITEKEESVQEKSVPVAEGTVIHEAAPVEQSVHRVATVSHEGRYAQLAHSAHPSQSDVSPVGAEESTGHLTTSREPITNASSQPIAPPPPPPPPPQVAILAPPAAPRVSFASSMPRVFLSTSTSDSDDDTVSESAPARGLRAESDDTDLHIHSDDSVAEADLSQELDRVDIIESESDTETETHIPQAPEPVPATGKRVSIQEPEAASKKHEGLYAQLAHSAMPGSFNRQQTFSVHDLEKREELFSPSLSSSESNSPSASPLNSPVPDRASLHRVPPVQRQASDTLDVFFQGRDSVAEGIDLRHSEVQRPQHTGMYAQMAQATSPTRPVSVPTPTAESPEVSAADRKTKTKSSRWSWLRGKS